MENPSRAAAPLRITKPATMSEQPAPVTAEQAKRNKRLAWIHVALALAVLAGFVLNIVSK